MALTPVDITHMRFKTALRGYSRQQVDAFVQSVKESLEQALTEKAELQRKLEIAQSELERIKKIESTMSSALTLAQKTADEIRANARRQAEIIIQEAEQTRVRMTIDAQREIERLRAEIGRLEAVRDRLAAELSSTLEAFKDLLEKRIIAAQRTESEAHRNESGDNITSSESLESTQPSASQSQDNLAPDSAGTGPERAEVA
jgi:cell division initiation protein